MTKIVANKRIKKVLGERAYAYMHNGTCNVWLRNSDYALADHGGPLFAIKATSYAEAVKKAEAGDIFMNAKEALERTRS